jgi:hypothetical protein
MKKNLMKLQFYVLIGRGGASFCNLGGAKLKKKKNWKANQNKKLGVKF